MEGSWKRTDGHDEIGLVAAAAAAAAARSASSGSMPERRGETTATSDDLPATSDDLPATSDDLDPILAALVAEAGAVGVDGGASMSRADELTISSRSRPISTRSRSELAVEGEPLEGKLPEGKALAAETAFE